jgi:cytochrome c biogenesis protein CcdA
MVFDVSVAMTWILFLALFPMAFIWLRRAWRIFFKKNYSEVAIKRGESPKSPEKWAPIVGIINLAAGAVVVWIIIGVPVWIASGILIGPFQEYDTWSAVAGMTIWAKIFADFIVKMQAHPFKFNLKKKAEGSKPD